MGVTNEVVVAVRADEKGEVEARVVPFAEAFRFWVKLGFISFGGPAGQIAIMHRELVERRRWIGEERFLHALNYCMLLPGPEAQQLAIYIGWLMHRTLGGIVAGVGLAGARLWPGAFAAAPKSKEADAKTEGKGERPDALPLIIDDHAPPPA